MRRRQQQTTGSSFKKFIFAAFSVAEIKLLIVFFYYWINIVLFTNSHSLFLRRFSRIVEQTHSFVACSAGGYRPECDPLKEELMQGETTVFLILHWISLTLFACISWVNLFFAVNISDVKAILNKLFKFNPCCK